jgi:hypothetical protein
MTGRAGGLTRGSVLITVFLECCVVKMSGQFLIITGVHWLLRKKTENVTVELLLVFNGVNLLQ